MNKFLFVSVPLVETTYPSAAYAALRPVVKKNNHDCLFYDLNLTIEQKLTEDEHSEYADWCMYATDSVSSSILKQVTNIYEQELKPRLDDLDWLGISVFSFYSVRPVKHLLDFLKTLDRDYKILLGGSGCLNKTTDTDEQEFGLWCIDQGLADYTIFGDGEQSLDALLKNNTTYPGINDTKFKQIFNLDELDYPDYQGIDWSNYVDPRILITSSRGCVRHCTFCDIDLAWPKYAYRSADKILDEIKMMVHEHGMTRFEFTDSLINGSVSNFNQFNEMLANEKERDPDLRNVTYTGQFICRNQKVMPEHTYELMHYAGCRQITVGIESFSERVRYHMKKKFSNADIDYHFEMSGRWNIPNVLLLIVGYPTETLQDHQQNLRALHRYKTYSDTGTIFMARWGLTMHIYEGTPIHSMSDDLGIVWSNAHDKESFFNWVSTANPELTLAERIRRRVELHEVSNELGYSMPFTRKELVTLLGIAETYINKPKRYTFPVITAE